MKPVRAITLLPGGLCGCNACRADRARDDAMRESWYAKESRNPVTKEG